jgi:hypothetical protein
LQNANSNVLFSSGQIGKTSATEIININVSSTQPTTTDFNSAIVVSVNVSNSSISSDQTLFRFKTSVSDSSISSNQITSINRVELTDSSDSLNQIIFKQKIQTENTSQSSQNIAFKQKIAVNDFSLSSNQSFFNQKVQVNDNSLSFDNLFYNLEGVTELNVNDFSASQQSIEFQIITLAEIDDNSNSSNVVSFEVVSTIDSAIINQNDVEIVFNDFEPAIEIEGTVISNSQSDLVVGDPEPIRNLMASLEPAVDQPGFGTQFMLINQYETPLDGQVEGKIDVIESGSIEGLIPDLDRRATWRIERSKDIVWYGRLGSYADSIVDPLKTAYESRIFTSLEEFYDSKYGDVYDAVYPITLNSSGAVDYDDEDSFYSGSMRLATPVKSVSITRNATALPLTKVVARPLDPSEDAFLFDTGQFDTQGLSAIFDTSEPPFVFTQKTRYVYGERIGGRNLFDVTNGRSYVGSTVGGEKRAKQFEFPVNSGIKFDSYDVPDKVSPYVLMPEDELAIACIVQPAPYDPSEYLEIDRESEEYLSQPSIEKNIPKFRTRLSGPGRIVLYGSYLRDGEPIAPESSQPLTSLALHEDVRGDLSPYGASYCMDQFQLEPRTSLRNGYLDRIVVGNMILPDPADSSLPEPEFFALPYPSGSIELEGFYDDDRQVTGSIIDRSLVLYDPDEPVPFDPLRYKKGLQRFVRLSNVNESYYDSHVPPISSLLAAITGSNEPDISIDLEAEPIQPLLLFSPFDPSLQLTLRSDSVQDAAKGESASSFALTGFRVASGSDVFLEVSSESIDAKTSVALAYGVGDNFGLPLSGSDGNLTNVLRGYRYGLSGIYPIGRSACFRHDRYGQFRDMFETSGDSVFFEEVETVGQINRILGAAPIKIRFVKRQTQERVQNPEETNSQNLSFFATSNLPYFDGLFNDRTTIQPDLIKPDPVENTLPI